MLQHQCGELTNRPCSDKDLGGLQTSLLTAPAVTLYFYIRTVHTVNTLYRELHRHVAIAC